MIYLLEGLDQETKDELFNALFGYDADSDRYYIRITEDNVFVHGDKDTYNEMGHQDKRHGDINDLVKKVLKKAYLISNTNYYSMDKIMVEQQLNSIRNSHLKNINYAVTSFDSIRKKMDEVEEKYYIIEVSLKNN